MTICSLDALLSQFSTSTWTKNFHIYKLDFEKAEEPEIKLQEESWRKVYVFDFFLFCFVSGLFYLCKVCYLFSFIYYTNIYNLFLWKMYSLRVVISLKVYWYLLIKHSWTNDILWWYLLADKFHDGWDIFRFYPFLLVLLFYILISLPFSSFFLFVDWKLFIISSLDL